MIKLRKNGNKKLMAWKKIYLFSYTYSARIIYSDGWDGGITYALESLSPMGNPKLLNLYSLFWCYLFYILVENFSVGIRAI